MRKLFLITVLLLTAAGVMLMTGGCKSTEEAEATTQSNAQISEACTSCEAADECTDEKAPEAKHDQAEGHDHDQSHADEADCSEKHQEEAESKDSDTGLPCAGCVSKTTEDAAK